ncbi:MurR/RpiR family transcriptional regulator [Fusibacter paucivorans]|uniref:MurR/RpiR family transcriptional regulator n=1 Tax=Fusibacter paucivorans TaxID=76009 RepID=A0ABS5PJJ6_9FIRM|nr:MurR/RpiR family transcriptional regulator [Fusibacter paucivorans]MBS7525293.1 MurR/RpiR family transcriptional regulator [Fusibacter paucivorans]
MAQFQFPDKNYTKNEVRILNYITANPADFVQLSIGEIAKKLGNSESTISRFARHTGYSDFKELRNAVLRHLEEQRSPADKLSQSRMLQQTSSLTDIMRYQQYCIEKTLAFLDQEQVSATISAIFDAKTIYIYAKGASLAIAQLLKFRLSRFAFQVILLPSGGSELFEVMNFISKDDLVFIIGFQKTPQEAKVLLKHQNIVPYKTVLISSRLYSKSKSTATYHLYTYRGEPNEYHSLAVPTALIDAIILMVAQRLGDQATQHLEDLHALKEQYKEDIPR